VPVRATGPPGYTLTDVVWTGVRSPYPEINAHTRLMVAHEYDVPFDAVVDHEGGDYLNLRLDRRFLVPA
jgi:hypothetical protein